MHLEQACRYQAELVWLTCLKGGMTSRGTWTTSRSVLVWNSRGSRPSAPGSGPPLLSTEVGDKGIWSRHEEKGLGELVEEKLYMSWQCVLPVRKANCILGCIINCCTHLPRWSYRPLNLKWQQKGDHNNSWKKKGLVIRKSMYKNYILFLLRIFSVIVL